MEIKLYHNPEYMDMQYNDCYLIYIDTLGCFIYQNDKFQPVLEKLQNHITDENVDEFAASRNFEKCVEVHNAFNNNLQQEEVVWYNNYNSQEKKHAIYIAMGGIWIQIRFNKRVSVGSIFSDYSGSIYRAISKLITIST